MILFLTLRQPKLLRAPKGNGAEPTSSPSRRQISAVARQKHVCRRTGIGHNEIEAFAASDLAKAKVTYHLEPMQLAFNPQAFSVLMLRIEFSKIVFKLVDMSCRRILLRQPRWDCA